jgi:hypothetical protein
VVVVATPHAPNAPFFQYFVVVIGRLDFTTSHTIMKITDFPAEIVLIVCNWLGCDDLLALRATCRWLRGPATEAVCLEARVYTDEDDTVVRFTPFRRDFSVSLADSSMDGDFEAMDMPKCWVYRIKGVVLSGNQKNPDCRIFDILTKLNLKQEFTLYFSDLINTDNPELMCLVEKANNSSLHFTATAVVNVNHFGDEEFAFDKKFTRLSLMFMDVVTSFNVIRLPQVIPCSIDLVVGRDNAHIVKEAYDALHAKQNLSISDLTLFGIQLDEEMESLEMVHKLNIHRLILEKCESQMDPETTKIACNAECVEATDTAGLDFFELTNVELLDLNFSDDGEFDIVEEAIPQLNTILPQLQSLKKVLIFVYSAYEPYEYGPYHELLEACSELPDLEYLNLYIQYQDPGISQSEVEAVTKACPKLDHLIITTPTCVPGHGRRLEYLRGDISIAIITT